jgi:hypothetical protein
MYQQATVKIKKIEHCVNRPGFDRQFHRVVFELEAECVPESTFTIWVHPAYPDSHLEKVAYTFLTQRLSDLSEAANTGAMDVEELKKLWEKVKPKNEFD